MIEIQVLSIPTRPLLSLPIFALARVRLRMEEVRDVTYAGSWMGMEHVLLNNHQPDRQQLLFDAVEARRRFFGILKLRSPGLRIYRIQTR